MSSMVSVAEQKARSDAIEKAMKEASIKSTKKWADEGRLSDTQIKNVVKSKRYSTKDKVEIIEKQSKAKGKPVELEEEDYKKMEKEVKEHNIKAAKQNEEMKRTLEEDREYTKQFIQEQREAGRKADIERIVLERTAQTPQALWLRQLDPTHDLGGIETVITFLSGKLDGKTDKQIADDINNIARGYAQERIDEEGKIGSVHWGALRGMPDIPYSDTAALKSGLGTALLVAPAKGGPLITNAMKWGMRGLGAYTVGDMATKYAKGEPITTKDMMYATLFFGPDIVKGVPRALKFIDAKLPTPPQMRTYRNIRAKPLKPLYGMSESQMRAMAEKLDKMPLPFEETAKGKYLARTKRLFGKTPEKTMKPFKGYEVKPVSSSAEARARAYRETYEGKNFKSIEEAFKDLEMERAARFSEWYEAHYGNRARMKDDIAGKILRGELEQPDIMRDAVRMSANYKYKKLRSSLKRLARELGTGGTGKRKGSAGRTQLKLKTKKKIATKKKVVVEGNWMIREEGGKTVYEVATKQAVGRQIMNVGADNVYIRVMGKDGVMRDIQLSRLMQMLKLRMRQALLQKQRQAVSYAFRSKQGLRQAQKLRMGQLQAQVPLLAVQQLLGQQLGQGQFQGLGQLSGLRYGQLFDQLQLQAQRFGQAQLQFQPQAEAQGQRQQQAQFEAERMRQAQRQASAERTRTTRRLLTDKEVREIEEAVKKKVSKRTPWAQDPYYRLLGKRKYSRSMNLLKAQQKGNFYV